MQLHTSAVSHFSKGSRGQTAEAKPEWSITFMKIVRYNKKKKKFNKEKNINNSDNITTLPWSISILIL